MSQQDGPFFLANKFLLKKANLHTTKTLILVGIEKPCINIFPLIGINVILSGIMISD